MSKIIKGVKKVFKKVAKVAKKVLPIVLAVAAVVFTGGAALGLASMAGGWGAAAASVSSALGASGVVGGALTGAITQAGYGALAGSIISKAQGGSFSDGARAGAAAGAVTGAVTGGIKAVKPAANSPTISSAPASTPVSADPQLAGTSGPPTPPNTPTPSKGLLSGVGGWVERNQTLVGNTVAGLGQGLMSGAQAESSAVAEKELMQMEHDLTASNYKGVNPIKDYTPTPRSITGPDSSQRFNASNYGSFEYRYNPKSGRIERTPVGNA